VLYQHKENFSLRRFFFFAQPGGDRGVIFVFYLATGKSSRDLSAPE
jgi:hypothetical protein